MKPIRPHLRRSSRRGTIYVVVLLSSLIVATIGLASLQLMRIQARSGTDSTDFIEARSYARAALEIGMLKIRQNANWRSQLGNGNWLTNQAIGNGKFTLSAMDPIDNNIATGDNHPVILTGIGSKGEATFRTSVRMEVGPRSGSCLETAMTSGNDLTVSGATLDSTTLVSSNHDVIATGGAIVNPNVEAENSITGTTYTGTTTVTSAARSLPDTTHVLDYYLTSGTTIPYSSLTNLATLNFVANPGFETNTTSWYAVGNCQIARSTTYAKSGTYSLKVSSRTSTTTVAAQDLAAANTSRMISGRSYTLTVPFVPTVNGNYRAVLEVTSTGSGTQSYATATIGIGDSQKNIWNTLTGTFTPNFDGTATTATLKLVTPTTGDYYIDDASLYDTGYSSTTYYMDRVLLSPASNPFGSVNTNGIYIIDCGGKDVIVQNCRIVGTLVFINSTEAQPPYVQGAMIWEPAVSNYPALLTTGTVHVAFTNTAPNESVLGFNMNPAGTPYPYDGGTTNETLSDAFAARITGLVYSQTQLKFAGAPSITGVVVANDSISVNASSLSLNYSSIYLNDPPPGFDVGTVTMKVVPGTWMRTVE